MMIKAYKTFWKQGTNFQGCSRLGDFWWALLAQLLIISIGMLLLVGLGMTVYPTGSTKESNPIGFAIVMVMVFISGLYLLASVIPTMSLEIRRLRDAGFHWAFFFLRFVPFGGLVLLIMYCQPSKPRPMDQVVRY